MTKTGLTVVMQGRLVYSELVKTKGPQRACLEERLDHVVKGVIALARKVDFTVIEGPAPGKGRAHPLAAVMVGQVSGVVRHRMWELGFPFAVVAPNKIKKYATGNGNANKQMMVEAAEPYFMETYDDNQADALFLALYGDEYYDQLVEEG